MYTTQHAPPYTPHPHAVTPLGVMLAMALGLGVLMLGISLLLGVPRGGTLELPLSPDSSTLESDWSADEPIVNQCAPSPGDRFNPCATIDDSQVNDLRDDCRVYGDQTCAVGARVWDFESHLMWELRADGSWVSTS